MKKEIKDLSELDAWNLARQVVLEMYKTTKNFPKEEIFGLIAQIRRASVSIVSNIAEGFGRYNFNDKVRFYYFANGSIEEVKTQLYVSLDLNYIDNEDFKRLEELIVRTQKCLKGLVKSAQYQQSLYEKTKK